MSKPISHNSARENPPAASEPSQGQSSTTGRRAADAEMARVLHTEPFRVALDSSGAGIAHWKHEPLHDVVEPMSHHVIMAYNGAMQHMERRSGRSVAIGTFRRGVVIIIPELPMGYSEACRCRSALSPSHNAETRRRRSRERHIERTPGANGAS
ncbi:hypothetical protein ABIF73_004875 [Bradyrhizobium japonicum]